MDFPENIVEALKDGLERLLVFENVVRRPLRPNDPNLTAGIFAEQWTPEEMNIGQYDPAITTYRLQIQSLVKHGDEEEGVAVHSRVAKKIRVMLYRNQDLVQSLGGLSSLEDGVTERTLQWGVNAQRFLANELQGTFVYASITEVWLNTEMV